MWMTDYIKAVKRGLRDVYGFEPLPGSTKQEPLLNPPDGVYPMKINRKMDYVEIKNDAIHCCRFKKPKGVKFAKKRRLTSAKKR